MAASTMQASRRLGTTQSLSRTGNIDPKPGFPDGHEQNVALKKAIAKVFLDIKKINPDDPDGSPWLLAWRMYPNADHPKWKDAGGEMCGCNCGCFIPR